MYPPNTPNTRKKSAARALYFRPPNSTEAHRSEQRVESLSVTCCLLFKSPGAARSRRTVKVSLENSRSYWLHFQSVFLNVIALRRDESLLYLCVCPAVEPKPKRATIRWQSIKAGFATSILRRTTKLSLGSRVFLLGIAGSYHAIHIKQFRPV